MNSKVLKIFIAALILLVGVGVVSAAEDAAADDAVSAEQTDEIAVADEDAVAAEESSGEALAAEADGAEEILAAEDSADAIAAGDNDNDVLTVASEPEKLKVSSDDVLGTKYKTISLGKIKIAKKYANSDSVPKKVQKSLKKQLKKLKKTSKKKMTKYAKKGWVFNGDNVYYDDYVKGKYYYIVFKLDMVKY